MRQYRLLQSGMARLFTLAFLLLTACGSGSTQQRAASMPTPQMTLIPTIPPVLSKLVHFTTQDHVRLAGLLYGHGGTTAIVCSHMWPDSKADWFAAAPWFAARGFMVLAYDFRGLGDSEGQADFFKLDKDLTAAITFEEYGREEDCSAGRKWRRSDYSESCGEDTGGCGHYALCGLFRRSSDQARCHVDPCPQAVRE